MERDTEAIAIHKIVGMFYDIEFPEYQREPDIWSRDQKQRLIDSILRQFDVSAIYLYFRPDGAFECIDGRQRLNAIMSFLGLNEGDERDNGFPLRLHNEISDATPHPYASLDELTYEEIKGSVDGSDGDKAARTINDYQLTVVYLSEVAEPDEFNLQFLRLNLGTLINAGEKLNAMVGGMRDVLFESDRIGKHPFFELVKMPTRRFAKEQTAAQVLLQAFSYGAHQEFTRARHFDLQRFVKQETDVTDENTTIIEVASTLDALVASFGDGADVMRNRAVIVSVVLVAWDQHLYSPERALRLEKFKEFVAVFLGRLRWQVDNMKKFKVDSRFGYLVEFQRHLTQASVEKPAVAFRHNCLTSEFARWEESGLLTGDADYEAEERVPPPVL